MVESEASFAARDLRSMDRAENMVLTFIGLAPLSLHRPGHTTTTLAD